MKLSEGRRGKIQGFLPNGERENMRWSLTVDT